MAKFSGTAALEMQVDVKGLKLTSTVDGNKCQLEITSPQVCFNCISGAQVHYKCRTKNLGVTIELAVCGRFQYPVKCSTNAIVQTVVSPLNSVRVDMECELTCPAS